MTLVAASEHLRDMAIPVWPSEERLAEMTGYSRRTIGTHLRAAEEAGWLMRTRRPKRNGRFNGNAYLLTIPSDRGQDLPTAEARNDSMIDAHRGQTTTSPWEKNRRHRGKNLLTNPNNGTPSNEPGAHYASDALVTDRAVVKKLVSEALGKGGAVSIKAKRMVCLKLAIANADPLVALYEIWPRSRTARNADAMFLKAADAIYRNASPAVKRACQRLDGEAASPEPLPPVQASPALRAQLATKWKRYNRS